jgi:hypothetical protein
LGCGVKLPEGVDRATSEGVTGTQERFAARAGKVGVGAVDDLLEVRVPVPVGIVADRGQGLHWSSPVDRRLATVGVPPAGPVESEMAHLQCFVKAASP